MKTSFPFFAVSLLFLSGCSLVSGSADGGIFRSDNGGTKFEQKVNIDEKTKIGGVDVLSMAVNPQNGDEVYIGSKSSGIFKTVDGGNTWRQLEIGQRTPGKIYSLAVDYFDARIVFATAVIDGRGKIIKSFDAGETWIDVFTEPSGGPFVLSVALNPTDSRKVFAGTTTGQIIFSENGGETWKNISEGHREIHKIAADFFNPNIIYFGIFQGGILKTEDGGKSFDDTQERGYFGNQQIGSPTIIAVDPNRTGWVYAGTEKGLYRSRNNGTDWELIRVLNNPDDNAIRGLAINPQNSDEIVYGASQAFYKSVDGGQSWATIQFAGSRSIEVIAYNRQNPSVIYVGMNKR